MNIFKSEDVLQFAVRMEENGGCFYRKAAELTENEKVKKLFEFLASEEDVHKGTFEKLLSKIEEFDEAEEYPGQYLEYLHSYIDGKVFFDCEESCGKSLDAAKALDFAIAREMDAIHYYAELKAFVSEKDKKTLDTIIEEERRHFAQLSELKKTV